MTGTQLRNKPNTIPVGNAACLRAGRASAVVGTTIGALIAWTFLHEVSGIDLAVRSGGGLRHVGAVSVAATSVAVTLAGWGLLALLERRVRHPHLVWSLTALIVFLISLLGALGGVSAADRAGLAGLHATVAVLAAAGLLGTRRLGR